MRPRTILIAAAAAVAVTFGVSTIVAAGDGDSARQAGTSGFEAMTITAGEVTVRIDPHHVDTTGAELAVTLDTHSEELDVDLVAGARLVVDGTEWPAIAWDGDGPGGHHREGRLRFDAVGSATGPVEVVLDGLAEPVAARWTRR